MQRVLIAEDHSIVIKGMKMIFETQFVNYHLDITKSIAGLMRMLQLNSYQLAIIDLQLEDGDTLHLITDLQRVYPELRILIFSANPEELYAQRLYKTGVKGYLNKQTDDQEIIGALRTILEGKTYVSEKFKKYLLCKSSDNPFDLLTLRELEVTHLLIQGRRSVDICKDLNIQASTVATYKLNIFNKLNVNNILELKALAQNFRLGS